MTRRQLTLFHLYPESMNLYGDVGNVIAVRRRCEWRGISLRVVGVSPGDAADFAACDILFMGGGQDRAQAMVAADLSTRGEAIRGHIEEGMVALTICGGFQLFGRSFTTAEGVELGGISVFDAETVAGDRRLIGDIVIDTDLGRVPWLATAERTSLVGFENHSGLTRLGPGALPLGRVLQGCGNLGDGTYEGAVHRNAIGTYLHGSLLPKNP